MKLHLTEVDMKFASKYALSAALGACGLMGLQNSAMAETSTVVNAGVCRAYSNADASLIQLDLYGIQNLSSSATPVICPLPRSNPSYGFNVTIRGSGSATCALSSYDIYGRFLDWKIGGFGVPLSLPPSSVPVDSSQSVYCYLGANARLYSIYASQP
jgi:hypothetical protein